MSEKKYINHKKTLKRNNIQKLKEKLREKNEKKH
jgi:hypothetical protein